MRQRRTSLGNTYLSCKSAAGKEPPRAALLDSISASWRDVTAEIMSKVQSMYCTL